MSLIESEDHNVADTAAALQERLSAAIAEPHQIHGNGIPYAVIPEGMQVESLEHLLLAPLRIRQEPTFPESPSFIRYVDAHKSPSTTLFANPEAGSILAVLDYHATGGNPGACLHRAHLLLPKSPEWNAWVGINGHKLRQAQLAEFLEDRAADIADPDGAVVAECAKRLELTKSANFTSGKNLDNGNVEFAYVEETQARGNTVVPTALVIGLAPFNGGAKYRVDAKLRHELRDDKLTFTVRLKEPEKVLEAAFKDVMDLVKAGTSCDVLIGSLGR